MVLHSTVRVMILGRWAGTVIVAFMGRGMVQLRRLRIG